MDPGVFDFSGRLGMLFLIDPALDAILPVALESATCSSWEPASRSVLAGVQVIAKRDGVAAAMKAAGKIA